ncbi:CbtA family protein [Mycobacterium hodleri]|uniref:CbtA family protein n=1 Tax=Mycolicibacterium hodleri TaxID=49897 RepID=UPI0021F3179A|nr:CbtA family protein [Mycolicibacterium hodleri]MCV7133277.1 CbtA family protein [Mycolicibacterium hodleri]
MNARAFLIRGLLAGLLAGFAAFGVAFVVGEPSVDKAIAIEEAGSAPAIADHHGQAEAAEPGHTHGEVAVVSRQDQSTWGLLTGTVTVGVTIGGLLALVAAGVMGRVGRLSPATSTAVVAGIGYVSVALVPFLKYPAAPPAVGDPDTIVQRTALYFAFVLISLGAAAVCTGAALRLRGAWGSQAAVLVGVGGYLAIVAIAGALMPSVDEIGTFPGDVLWDFRLGSIFTSAALWATVGGALVVMVGRLHAEHLALQARREFARSL